MKRITEFGLKTKLDFGKHKGKTMHKVIKENALYVEWCLKEKIFTLNLIAKVCYNYHWKKADKRRTEITNAYQTLAMMAHKAGWMDDGNGNSGPVNGFEDWEEYY